MMFHSSKLRSSDGHKEVETKNKRVCGLNEHTLTLIAILMGFVGLVLSFLYIAYSFYNMTSEGLINVLTIFGEGILIDLFLFRPLSIFIISIFSTRRNLIN